MVYRRDSGDNVIVEYGDPVLDLSLRMRVHATRLAIERYMYGVRAGAP